MIKDLTLMRIKQTLRSKEFYLYVMAFPLFFLILYGILGPSSAPIYKTIDVGIVNHDQGAIDPFTGQLLNISDSFIQVLSNKTNENNVKFFNLHYYSEDEELTTEINKLKISGGLVIPENFSENIANATRAYASMMIVQLLSQEYYKHPSESANITKAINYLTPYFNAKANISLYFRGDVTLESTMTAYSACWEIIASFVRNYTVNYAEKMWNWLKIEYSFSFELEIKSEAKNQMSVVYNVFLVSSSGEVIKQFSREYYSRLLPGQVLQAVLLGSVNAVWLLDVENSTGLLKRMKITKLRSWQYITSFLLSWALIALLQGLVMLGIGTVMGFMKFSLNPLAWLMILITIVLSGVMSAAIAIFVVSFARARIATPFLILTITTVVLFVAEYFITAKPIAVASGKVFTALDFIPFRAPFLVMKNCFLMQSNFSFQIIWLDLLITVAWTILIFVIGVVLFNKFKFQYAEKQ